MNPIMRRLRATLTMSLTWAAFLAPFGAGWAFWERWRFQQEHGFWIAHPWQGAARAAIELGAWGALAGAAFSVALIVLARRGREARLLTPRGAGAAGAFAALALTSGYALLRNAGVLPGTEFGLAQMLAVMPSAAVAYVAGVSALGGAAAASVVALARRQTETRAALQD